MRNKIAKKKHFLSLNVIMEHQPGSYNFAESFFNEKTAYDNPYGEMRYPYIFVYIMMCLLCLSVPTIDLFLYAIWLRWSSSQKGNAHKKGKKKVKSKSTNEIQEDDAKNDTDDHLIQKDSVPFPLKSLQYGATWTPTQYIGLTEYLWKFTTIGWKGIVVSLSWPFWLIPITIGSFLYIILTVLHYIVSKLLSFVISSRDEDYYECEPLSDEEEDREQMEERKYERDSDKKRK